MSFDNASNRGRAEKIAAILAHVAKSAKSNGASPAEIATILSPARAAMAELFCDAEPAHVKETITVDFLDGTAASCVMPPPTEAPKPKTTAHPWHTVREMALEAPLRDLPVALAVMIERLEAAALGRDA